MRAAAIIPSCQCSTMSAPDGLALSGSEHAPGETPQPCFGLTIATCEVHQSPDGLYAYNDDGRHEMAVERGLPAREAEMWEFYDAIANDRPLMHGERWGEATLEVCLAILKSAA